jgi:hypothetical protein
VEAGADAVALPPPLPCQKAPPDTTVARLLATEIPPSPKVDRLNRPQLREEYTDVGRTLWTQLDPVEGALVGVERDDGGRGVAWWARSGVDENGPSVGQVELGDPMARVGEDRAGMGRDGNHERGPLSAS